MREEQVIDLTRMSVDEDTLCTAYSTLYATDPALFFICAEYSVAAGQNNTVAYLRPTYRLSGEARAAAEADFAARVRAIVSPLSGMTDTEKVTYLHDYMVSTYDYDDAYRVYDAYSLLVGGRGVCQAYALLYTALCRAAGVPCRCVTCFEREHEWNAVYLAGSWHHVDLIWDDSDSTRLGEVSHTYFLINDTELYARRALRNSAWDCDYSWDAPVCSDTRLLSSPLRRSEGAAAVPGDGRVYFVADSTLYCMEADLTCRALSSPSLPAGLCPALATDGTKLYCHTATVLYVYAPATAVFTPLTDPLPKGVGVLGGIAMQGDLLAVQTLYAP